MLSEDFQLDDVSKDAVMFAATHGILMEGKSVDSCPAGLITVPFTLLPSAYPRSQFVKANDIQEQVGELIHSLSLDDNFIYDCLKDVAVADEFTSRLLNIKSMVQQQGSKQSIKFGMFRSDYMLDMPSKTSTLPECTIKQVEVNTISPGFASLGARIPELHRYLLERYELGNYNDIPVNDSLTGLIDAFAKVVELYDSSLRSVIVMVVLPDERNSFDQKFIEHLLFQKYKIKLIRRTLKEIATQAEKRKDSKIFIDGMEVAMFYFRAGYSPDHYPTEDEWVGRETIELSAAVKCPCVDYHLIGTKKVQQMVESKAVLLKLLPSMEVSKVSALHEVFTGLYPVEYGSAIVEEAKANPHKFVLKPQREGGGNNLYHEEIVAELQLLKKGDVSQFILMDRIVPPSVPNYLVRGNKVIKSDTVSELGIFAILITDGDKIVENKSIGYLLRSKSATVEDGGVAAGIAVLDSPILV